MSLYITSLNSGSNGNCYYIGNDQEAVLVDAGISCKETEKRMASLGLSMHKVKAIFISHEHADHIKGLAVLAHKYQLPVYITPITLKHTRISLSNAISFSSNEPVMIGSLSVSAFPKFHDAEDPHSFTITNGKVTIGVFTDIGEPCSQLASHFNKCHAAFLEANYDEMLLENGRYPYFLKNRIRGGKGHLSNKQALDVFIKHRSPFMTHLLLSHLSKDNNCPKIATELFNDKRGNTTVVIASRYEATSVYEINASVNEKVIIRKRVRLMPHLMQLSLFGESSMA